MPLVLVVVMMQVGLQMGIGYFYGKALRLNESGCRSLLFEVGISNSALAAVLANSVFGPLAAVAAIVNMVCNLTLGSLVAALFNQRKIDDAHRALENIKFLFCMGRSLESLHQDSFIIWSKTPVH